MRKLGGSYVATVPFYLFCLLATFFSPFPFVPARCLYGIFFYRPSVTSNRVAGFSMINKYLQVGGRYTMFRTLFFRNIAIELYYRKGKTLRSSK